jgi:formiminoglutamase
LTALDFGNVADPDGSDGEERVRVAVADAAGRCELLVVIGGDNSLTFSAVRGMFGDPLENCGLVTVDAHHDLRDGISNGSPVRRLLDSGLAGDHVVQLGIADFSNSTAYASRARELGITVIPRAELRAADLSQVAEGAMDLAGAGGRPVFVDVDIDVCDRSQVPGCPSAAPGGLSADELRQLTFELARDPRVRGIDLTEVDASADTEDGRTVRLAAVLVLEAAAGLAKRREANEL